jgi:hypothetical protein
MVTYDTINYMYYSSSARAGFTHFWQCSRGRMLAVSRSAATAARGRFKLGTFESVDWNIAGGEEGETLFEFGEWGGTYPASPNRRGQDYCHTSTTRSKYYCRPPRTTVTLHRLCPSIPKSRRCWQMQIHGMTTAEPASLELSMKLKVETQSTSLPINRSVNEVLPSAGLISVQKLGHAEND